MQSIYISFRMLFPSYFNNERFYSGFCYLNFGLNSILSSRKLDKFRVKCFTGNNYWKMNKFEIMEVVLYVMQFVKKV